VTLHFYMTVTFEYDGHRVETNHCAPARSIQSTDTHTHTHILLYLDSWSVP